MTDIDILLDLLIFVAVLLHKLVPEGLHRLPGLLVPPLHHGLQADPHHGVALTRQLVQDWPLRLVPPLGQGDLLLLREAHNPLLPVQVLDLVGRHDEEPHLVRRAEVVETEEVV